jgi:Na+/proline symporter
MFGNLYILDWIFIIVFLAISMGVGLWFSKRASESVDSYFVSGRTLSWWLAGISIIATGFASDTPIWISSLIRRCGVHYAWQYWAPFIGAALAAVLFARLWRRLGVITDVEFIELRYSGNCASTLRFATACTQALLFCPLVISWVTKAMVVIASEVTGISREYSLVLTLGIVGLSIIISMSSGLWGVIYTDLLQFVLAIVGTSLLAFFAVREVGGLGAMVTKLGAMTDWPGHALNLVPSIGSEPTQMSVWNAIGYFGILWIIQAVQGGWGAQRLLACRNAKHATYAQLLAVILYFGVIAWPWILTGICSVILLPTLGDGADNDVAYPRMIIMLMPVLLRGMVVAAMIAAFISTVITLFNWGSSYLINDVYRRFLVKNVSQRHYVNAARMMTVGIGLLGGIISMYAENVQQLLSISFVAMAGSMSVNLLLRWFWWRFNAAGDLAILITAYIVSPLMLFTTLFNGPAAMILRLPETVQFNSDPNLLGARMLLVMLISTAVGVIVSLMTKPTEEKKLEEFVMRVRPFHFFWMPVIKRIGCVYHEDESLGRTLVSWLILTISVGALIFGIGNLLFGSILYGIVFIIVFGITMYLTIRRINKDFENNSSIA